MGLGVVAMTVFRDQDLSGVRLERVRGRGAELVDVEVSGELVDVVVNGVDIAPLVDAELDRRTPERVKTRPDDVAGFGEAWAILERLWDGTLARARALPEAESHRGVDGEWSFIQTLRHSNFARAAWVGRMVLGDASPWHGSLAAEQLASEVTRTEPGLAEGGTLPGEGLPADRARRGVGAPALRRARPGLTAGLTP